MTILDRIIKRLTDNIIIENIHKKYPDLEITIIDDNEGEPCYWVMIHDKDIYYSKEYLSLITKIKLFLWGIGIYNYYFGCE
jgi:hypothetical protein